MRKQLKESVLFVYLYRFLIALILLGFSRMLLYFFNIGLFYKVSFWDFFYYLWQGFRFDLALMGWVNLPIILLLSFPTKLRLSKIYHKRVEKLFYLINIIPIGMNMVDLAYYKSTLKRTTGDFFKYLGHESEDTIHLIPQYIIDFWYVVLLWVLFGYALVYFSKKLKINDCSLKPASRFFYLRNSFISIFLLTTTIIIARGGIKKDAIGLSDAGRYGDSRNTALILGTPFTFMKTMDQKSLEIKNYFPQNELEIIYNPVHQYKKDSLAFHDKNVIIIILESFSKEHIGALNKAKIAHKSFTPFLDSLIGHSLTVNAYANGNRSIEAIPSILASLPTLMTVDYITSKYSSNCIHSLASLLKYKGYTTSFFHGGNNNTMGFNIFTKLAGIDHYYGRTDYNNEKDFDGKWGIFDEPFLQYMAEQLNQMKEPFFSSVFTLTSHHPFPIPEKYIGKFPAGKIDIHRSIGYTDYALKKFFDTAKKMPWFENTLFIITADHTSDPYIEDSYTQVGRYEIPLIFYQVNSKLKGHKNIRAQQADILPSVMDHLNFDKAFIAFGESIFDESRDNFAISYLAHNYQLIKGDYVLQFEFERTTGFYNLVADPFLNNNLKDSDSKVKAEMENFLKAIIQQYNYRFVNNKLRVDH